MHAADALMFGHSYLPLMNVDASIASRLDLLRRGWQSMSVDDEEC